jgi:hypothetical protein
MSKIVLEWSPNHRFAGGRMMQPGRALPRTGVMVLGAWPGLREGVRKGHCLSRLARGGSRMATAVVRGPSALGPPEPADSTHRQENQDGHRGVEDLRSRPSVLDVQFVPLCEVPEPPGGPLRAPHAFLGRLDRHGDRR